MSVQTRFSISNGWRLFGQYTFIARRDNKFIFTVCQIFMIHTILQELDFIAILPGLSHYQWDPTFHNFAYLV